MLEIDAPATLSAGRAAPLLFLLFIHVADAEGGLTARDVQSLNKMLDRTDWTESLFLRSAQAALRSRYFEFWQDYQKGGVTRDLPLISEQLTALLATPGAPPEAEIRIALEAFLDRLAHNASPVLVRLGLAVIPACRRTARAEIGQLLRAASTAPQAPLAMTLAPATVMALVPPARTLSLWPAAALAPSAANTWQRGRIEVRCAAVIVEAPDVRTFVFVAVKPVLMVYEPGQFVTLELPIGGKTVRRSYTMSSSPSRPCAISITVKRAPLGAVSNWLHDNLCPAGTLHLSGPHGMFSCFNAPAPKLLLLAAGSGVTPIMSMLRWLADTASEANIVLINNIRTPADIIFSRELTYLATRLGDQLRLGIMPAADGPGIAWNGPVGRFSEQVIQLWAPDFVEREVFVCGPPGYMKVVRATLERIGLPMAQYHEESFGTPAQAMVAAITPPPVARALPASVAGRSAPPPIAEASATVEVVFAKSGKTVTAVPGDFLLDLAEEHGIAIASGCRAGNCGTCKVVKTEGNVVMDEQTALSAGDIADGYVLTCVGRAFGQKIVMQA
jgi:ferredoxin-NADP reductase